jgi:hypothetical protein
MCRTFGAQGCETQFPPASEAVKKLKRMHTEGIYLSLIYNRNEGGGIERRISRVAEDEGN